ncbi:RagB/SusD family nutrient uptake outer membrane protein [Mariniflexile litorale]|uniref:RagB/SusD family nutrient uptake outer membrane protein n=1 Tax=Mariniflexile litorale TaxID=3045158 RepID=A0AAU7EG99_9FLAO|nr:RagB/SusD family nutrient uptake outer membrane protein [Mariniflexile sp. KMM 9835]MDQ8211619.1 RagB/SusD family nutrient uptake outer membrane protein [Mariniflexile sp. KMM 9835]
MKIRSIKNSIALFMVLLGTSCSEYLDVVPENVAVIEDAFETRDGAERFLATLYNALPNFSDASTGNPALIASDEIFLQANAMGTSNWHSHRISIGGQNTNNPLIGYWGNANSSGKNLFIALRNCNIFLENLDEPFDLKLDEKVRWEAEAKFLKAYYHFYLMRMYGPIPIIDENIEVGAGLDVVRVTRKPIDEVVTYIVQLLDEAIPNLPNTIIDITEYGRISAPIASAIKARVMVTAASPFFNGNTDYSTFKDKDGNNLFNQTYSEEKWELAATACKEAIDIAEEAGLELYNYVDGISGLSDRTKRKLSIRNSLAMPWNGEVIWGATGSLTDNLQEKAQGIIDPNVTSDSREELGNSYSPTLAIAEMFYTENGVPIDEDVNFDYANRYDVVTADASEENYIELGFQTAKLHMNREPRFHASLAFDGGVWFGQGRTSESNPFIYRGKKGELSGNIDNKLFSISGYLAKKLVNYENVLNNGNSIYSIKQYPFPVIRLADIYLLYAEALNESGNTPEAQIWIDKVRERAGLDGVVASWASASNNPTKPTTKDGFREIVQQERMIELVFEGQRYWDIKRWKRATDFFNRDVKGWNVQGISTTDYYNIIPTGTLQFSSRDYLWPISETDIINNNKLIQNPGW